MVLCTQLPWVFIFGILGNIVSLMVYLVPVRTFYKVAKKKTSEGFQSLPYLASLFSCMLWIYYAYFKSDAFLVITINSVGCVIESIYIVIYISYAPKKARRLTLLLLLLFNIGGFSSIALITYFFTHGQFRVKLLGWICLVFSVAVFAAPSSIMRRVIRTKSVEFMPFSLSFCLTLNAVIWFFYGLLSKDFYIALPNIIGFVFGVLQMALYMIIKNHKLLDQKLSKNDNQDTIQTAEVHPVCSIPIADENKEEKLQNLQEQSNHDQTTDASNQV